MLYVVCFVLVFGFVMMVGCVGFGVMVCVFEWCGVLVYVICGIGMVLFVVM